MCIWSLPGALFRLSLVQASVDFIAGDEPISITSVTTFSFATRSQPSYAHAVDELVQPANLQLGQLHPARGNGGNLFSQRDSGPRHSALCRGDRQESRPGPRGIRASMVA